MRHTVVLTVGLKITDNEARSALEALQEKMGLRDRVRDLGRDEVWEFGVEAPGRSGALATIERLVLTTNLFVNPNKHSFTIDGADEPAEETRPDREGSDDGSATRESGAQENVAAHSDSRSADEVAILVSEREGGEEQSMLSAIGRIGVDGVVSARRWTRWRVRLNAPPTRDDETLLPLIRRIAVATGRSDGLLSNPHSQISRAVLPWGEEKVLAA